MGTAPELRARLLPTHPRAPAEHDARRRPPAECGEASVDTSEPGSHATHPGAASVPRKRATGLCGLHRLWRTQVVSVVFGWRVDRCRRSDCALVRPNRIDGVRGLVGGALTVCCRNGRSVELVYIDFAGAAVAH